MLKKYCREFKSIKKKKKKKSILLSLYMITALDIARKNFKYMGVKVKLQTSLEDFPHATT